MGETPLHYAVRSGKLEVVKLLTKYAADPRIASFESGKTPFDVASEYNQMEVLEHLTGTFLFSFPLPFASHAHLSLECTMQLASEDVSHLLLSSSSYFEKSVNANLSYFFSV